MAPPENVLSSGSVVFALPHVREAIFFYHAAELVKDRKAQLDAIPRPVTEAFWDSFKKEEGDDKPEVWFAKRLAALSSGTNLLSVTEKLGLHLASYIDFLASRPHDVLFRVSASSVLGNSRKWEAEGRYNLRLEAHPREVKDGATVHEEPHSNPAEMLWHANGYNRSRVYHRASEWGDMEGLSHILRDKLGRVFVLRLMDTHRHGFLLAAALSHPGLLYSDDSPFLPTYDVFEYNKDAKLGAAITQCPPFPLGPDLIPDSGRQQELRRILERAHDMFASLAALHERGISLNNRIEYGWADSLSTARDLWGGEDSAFFLIPAYLSKTLDSCNPGKLSRAGIWEESLPAAPATAWPMAPLAGKGGIAGLPWSQVTAYNDPRVAGPKIYLYGVTKASFSDDDYQAVLQQRHHTLRDLGLDRFEDDLRCFALHLLRLLLHNTLGENTLAALRSSHSTLAYEQCLRSGADQGLLRCERGHSGLFTFCLSCARKTGQTFDYGRDEEDWATAALCCSACGFPSVVQAFPDAVRLLLLRIMEPEMRGDGSKIIVTAKEAHETMKAVLATELPRIERVYHDWVNKQPKIERIGTAGPLPLDKIQRDVSAARWSMFEMLRGNHLDARFRRADHIKLRDAMRAFHAEKKKREEEREAKRRGDMAANAVDAPQRAGTSSPAADEGSASTSPRCTAAPDGVKRSAGGSEDEAQASKKAKAA